MASNAEIADKLDEARALIEKGWTQAAYARGKSGRSAVPSSRAAVCFCAVGALAAASRKKYPNSAIEGIRELSLSVGGDGYETAILEWNDAPERTQAEVIEAFRKAAELARDAA